MNLQVALLQQYCIYVVQIGKTARPYIIEEWCQIVFKLQEHWVTIIMMDGENVDKKLYSHA